jgi:hypothetical protein
MAENGLVQKIDEVTWRRVKGEKSGKHVTRCSTLDHIYTNAEDEGTFGLLDCAGGDHEMVGFKFKDMKMRRIPTLKIQKRDWRGFMPEAIQKDVLDHRLEIEDTMAVEAKSFEDFMHGIINEFAQLRSIRARNKHDILNVKIEGKKKRRDRLFKKHHKNPGDK